MAACKCGAAVAWAVVFDSAGDAPVGRCPDCYRRDLTSGAVVTARPFAAEPLDTAGMTYDPAARRLVTESSDYEATRTGFPQTVTVRSHKTGAVVPFVRVGAVYAGNPPDRDLAAVVYRNAATGVELHVLND